MVERLESLGEQVSVKIEHIGVFAFTLAFIALRGIISILSWSSVSIRVDFSGHLSLWSFAVLFVLSSVLSLLCLNIFSNLLLMDFLEAVDDVDQ